MPDTVRYTRVLAAFEGCYDARRASALSGVPLSTIYDWARKDVITPSVSPASPKRWSYADLIVLRVVYWLRHPKEGQTDEIPASPMSEVRRALAELEELEVDIWSDRWVHRMSLRVDLQGSIYVVTPDRLEDTHRMGVFGETLDLLGPFNLAGNGPDLITPRPHLRIVPGRVSGEPHVAHSRITSLALAALYERFQDVEYVAQLYPDLEVAAIQESIELETELAA